MSTDMLWVGTCDNNLPWHLKHSDHILGNVSRIPPPPAFSLAAPTTKEEREGNLCEQTELLCGLKSEALVKEELG